MYCIVPPSLMQFEAKLAGIHVAITGKRTETDGIRWHRVTHADRIKQRHAHHRPRPHPTRPRARRLRRAIAAHIPQLAETKSHLECVCVEFLISRNFELPIFNHDSGKATIDAIYTKQRVAIELDGIKGDAGERRILRDQRRDLHRRREGSGRCAMRSRS